MSETGARRFRTRSVRREFSQNVIAPERAANELFAANGSFAPTGVGRSKDAGAARVSRKVNARDEKRLRRFAPMSNRLA